VSRRQDPAAREDLELALRITERIRSTLDLEEVLQQTVTELGGASGASRCLLQLQPDSGGTSLMIEWDRGDTRPLGYRPPTPIARRVFERGEPIVIDDVGAHGDGEVRAYLESVGSVAAVNYPIAWRGSVLAVLGFQDDRPRDWSERAIPLLERVEGQVAAALDQARGWEEQRRAVKEMERLGRLREELIANVSHELRTPLAAILGAVETLRRDDVPLDGEIAAQLLASLTEQSKRLQVLADDLLQLARLQAGEVRLRAEPSRLTELLRRAREGIEIGAGRAVHMRVSEDGPVEVDRARIVQVFSNLIENAARHGDGDITIDGSAGPEGAVVAVSDEGSGVATEHLESMFEPFAHHGDRPDSSGLGLSIARGIVEAHGGTLLYEQPDGDRRHRFVVRLPQPGRGGGGGAG